jgi:uncharacterized ferritin-like protein (DUF455 family)
MVFAEGCIYKKIAQIEEACHLGLLSPRSLQIPVEPARDILVLRKSEAATRPGLASSAGQIRLLHDLANIELQAMELGLRTLIEFPQAPPTFREQLAAITLEEATHPKLCLRAIESLGGKWGDAPIHLGLWAAVSSCDHLLERVFIVHRYLESSGLDAGEGLLRRLSGVGNKEVSSVVQKIVDEEVAHVEFGSRWYFSLCQEQKIDPFDFYKKATDILVRTNPRKEGVHYNLRRRAGFQDREIEYLAELKQKKIN